MRDLLLEEYSQEETNKIMAGYDKAMVEWEKEFYKTAPRCHFRVMEYCEGEVGDGTWWECSVCGHTKTGSEHRGEI